MLFQFGLDAVSIGAGFCFIWGLILFHMGLAAVSAGAKCCFNWG